MIKQTPTGYIHTMDDEASRARQVGELGLVKSKPRPQMVAALLVLKEAGQCWVPTGIVARKLGKSKNAWGILNRLVKHKLAEQRGGNQTSEWRAL